ncbi:MAG: TetR/AcrR family transcriptional regulator [Betaproteobacteria bacterium]|nr:TetR/AcrR family transcriptional regulator [Betaproteobacteria bacterium]
MGKTRDSDRTRKRILECAVKEFSERGFDGARISEIARRARLSKQLIHHHFRGKEALFQAVHDLKFRPTTLWNETLPPDPADLFAERFRKRAKDLDYLRFLTWEAASARNRKVPGEAARGERLAQYGAGLRLLQAEGRLPRDLDSRLLQLAILALATYPMAFTQITRMVTGHAGPDRRFQREWHEFLRKLGKKLFDGTTRTIESRSSAPRASRGPG